MPFLSMAFLNRAEFLIENGHHKKNTLLAVEKGAFELNSTWLDEGCVAWLPKDFLFSRKVRKPLTLLFAETDQNLPLSPGAQRADSVRVRADIALLRGKSVHDAYAMHLLNDIVWCCKIPEQPTCEMVRMAKDLFVRGRYRADFSKICESCGVSQAWLIHQFRTHTGMTPNRYFAKMKLDKAKEMLLDTSLRISEVSDACGYESAAYFSNCFRADTGMAPRAFRDMYVL